jgi:outer membrane translocation and assembly module TamA
MMFFDKPKDLFVFSPLLRLCCWCSMVYLLSACTGVKNAPRNIPYAYDNKVIVRADGLTAGERNLLEETLLDYLDDSLKVNTISVLGKTRRINPPVFDTVNVTRSKRFINGYLNSTGYYNAQFDSVSTEFTDLRPKKPEIRVTTRFYLSLGQVIRVGRLNFKLGNAGLQRIADSVQAASLLLPGTPYSKDKLAAELDRLATAFRNAGYLRISRSALIAEADTTDAGLTGYEPDPVNQVKMAYLHRARPLIHLDIQLRAGLDSFLLQPYTVDSVVVIPDVAAAEDLNQLHLDTTRQWLPVGNRLFIKQKSSQFGGRVIQRNMYLQPGSLYDERHYFKTLNAYTQMGAWQQVDARFFTRSDTVPAVNVYYYLLPAKRQSFQIDLEGSQNNNISVSNVLAGRFLALAINTSHRNRNVFKSGTQSTTTASFGLELNNTQNATNPNFFQTFIVNVGQSYSLPRLIAPFNFLDKRGIDAGRTNINLNLLYTERFRFFSQTSVSSNLQWEWRKGRSKFNISLPNFETVFLQQFQDSLDKVIIQNPSLRFAFTPGNILSVRSALEQNVKYRKKNHLGFYRVSAEYGTDPGFRLFNNDFFHFLRFEGQYVEGIQYKRSSLHYRFYGGVGWDVSGTPGATLPFFRQFVAGGNNSMRAWGLRQLGLGNSIVSDTAQFTDRFGDIQLEANVEFRFRLFRLFGYHLEGAAFADVGNIWNHRSNADGQGSLTLNGLYRDLAVGIGTGIRWDFSYLVIRLDAAYKVKDPVRDGNGWMKSLAWREANRLGAPLRNNVGFQFGIGYPF